MVSPISGSKPIRKRDHDIVPPQSHAYGDVDSSTDSSALIELMSYMASHTTSTELMGEIRNQLDLHQGDRVLDVGCGTAPDCERLAQDVGPDGSVLCADSSAKMINYCREHHSSLPNIDFRIEDVRNLRLPENSFNRIRCMRVLHHLSGMDPRCAIGELSRVLEYDGVLVIAEPQWSKFTFTDSETEVGQIVRNNMLSDFCQQDLDENIPSWLSTARLNLISHSVMFRDVDSLVDFNLFYGLERSCASLNENQGADCSEFLKCLRRKDARNLFQARLPFNLWTARKC